MAYTLDTTVGELMKDAHAVEMLEQYVPGASTNPMLGMAEGMTLRSLLDLPQARQLGVTEEMVTKVLSQLNDRK